MQKWFRWWFCAWMMCSSLVSVVYPSESWAQAPDREFTIAVGETLVFNSRSISKVTVGLEDIATVVATSDQREIIITGVSPGVTTINFISREGQKTLLIRVVPINPVALENEVREILGERSGVEVRRVAGRVLLEGEVASERFKTKIERLVQLYPSQVLNFTSFRESFVEGAKVVAMDVYFLQVITTDRDNLGLQWGQFFGANATFGARDVPLYYDRANTTAGVLPGELNPAKLPYPALLTGGDSGTSYVSLVGNLNLALDFLVQNGLVKTIQRGLLVTEAGTLAEYHTGGTLLIPVATLNTFSVLEKEYGLRLTVKPIVDVDNRVKLDVVAEFSELDQANGVNDIPALRNNTFKAIINMQEGQSVLIGGLDGEQETANETGWWLLNKIPILGWLFKSRSYLAQRTSNALFITPRLYEPGGKYHRELVAGMFAKLVDGGMEESDLPNLSKVPPAPRQQAAPRSEPPSGGATDLDEGQQE